MNNALNIQLKHANFVNKTISKMIHSLTKFTLEYIKTTWHFRNYTFHTMYSSKMKIFDDKNKGCAILNIML